jgi:two-component system, NarL family, sensor kinase
MTIMQAQSTVLDSQIETIAELRELYRAAEARAARLRLLSSSGREMAKIKSDGIEDVLGHIAAQLAYFLGRTHADISFDPHGPGMPIHAPGDETHVVGRIHIHGLSSLDDITDDEDRDAYRMHIEMMGATIDRIHRERERTKLLQTLHERELHLEHLVGRIFSAQEEERRRVSHDLHDGVAQTATALVRMLEGGSSQPAADIPAASRTRLTAIARDVVAELRAVIAGLRPTLLDDLGLDAAIRALADALSGDGFEVIMMMDSPLFPVSGYIETALFRVAQEAVNNVRKHAQKGCRVEVELRQSEFQNAPYLRVENCGKGHNHDQIQGHVTADGNHIGINVMRERMAAAGGKLLWEATPNGGVRVIAHFPEAT